MNKSTLKENYYYEEKDWYESCPEILPEPPKFKIKIFPKVMTHQEILDTYKIVPYTSYGEAAAVCASIIPGLKNNYKSRIVYFKENDVLFRFGAWRDGDGRLRVNVRKVYLDRKYDAEHGVAFSNDHLETSHFDTSSLSPLELRIKNLEDWARNLGMK